MILLELESIPLKIGYSSSPRRADRSRLLVHPHQRWYEKVTLKIPADNLYLPANDTIIRDPAVLTNIIVITM